MLLRVDNWIEAKQRSAGAPGYSFLARFLIPETYMCLGPKDISISCPSLKWTSKKCCRALGRNPEIPSHYRFNKCKVMTLGNSCFVLWKMRVLSGMGPAFYESINGLASIQISLSSLPEKCLKSWVPPANSTLKNKISGSLKSHLQIHTNVKTKPFTLVCRWNEISKARVLKLKKKILSQNLMFS